MPLISVVIPAYNAEHTILETIESVQQQTFSDHEIIVIDDGSKDRTLEVLKNLEDQRIKVFSYENAGACVSRNRGITQATGEFIAFLDADDLWTPDKLELQLAALQKHPEAGVAYSWTYTMYKRGESLCFMPCSAPEFEGNIYPQLLVTNFIGSGSNILVRRQAIESVGGFDPALKACQDWDYHLRLAAHCSYVLVPKSQILYRKSSSGTITSKVDVMEEQGRFMIEKAYQAAPPELQYLKTQCLSNFQRYCADLYLQYSNNFSGVRKAGQKLWSSIHLRPKILLERHTQKLVARFILMQFLSPGLTNYLVGLNRKVNAVADPRIQNLKTIV